MRFKRRISQEFPATNEDNSPSDVPTSHPLDSQFPSCARIAGSVHLIPKKEDCLKKSETKYTHQQRSTPTGIRTMQVSEKSATFPNPRDVPVPARGSSQRNLCMKLRDRGGGEKNTPHPRFAFRISSIGVRVTKSRGLRVTMETLHTGWTDVFPSSRAHTPVNCLVLNQWFSVTVSLELCEISHCDCLRDPLSYQSKST